jgi:hypothetical protein
MHALKHHATLIGVIFMSYVPVKNKFNLPHGSAQGDSFQTLCAISNTIIPWSISCVGTQT